MDGQVLTFTLRYAMPDIGSSIIYVTANREWLNEGQLSDLYSTYKADIQKLHKYEKV